MTTADPPRGGANGAAPVNPAVVPGAGLPDDLPRVDLRTLLGELIALRAEVRAVTEEAREARKTTDAASSALRDALARSEARNEAVRRAADDDRRRSARALIDVFDRLETALQGADVPVRRGWFGPRRPDPALTAVRDGLALTLRGLGDRLDSLGVSRVPTVGVAYDPATMEALRAVETEDAPDGVVTAEITSGWRDERGALRPAQVVVNRRPRPPSVARSAQAAGD